jgi:HEAT repeat protein
MERQFEDMNEQYFKGLLDHHDSVVHTRAVSLHPCRHCRRKRCRADRACAKKHDNNTLVRHKAAFSLSQLGFTSGVAALADAVRLDLSLFVCHEAAVALGGSDRLRDARKTLDAALKDESEEVRESAVESHLQTLTISRQ